MPRGLGSSGLTDPDSVPEIPDQPITRPGGIWLLGDHRVGCGDSTSAADVTPVLAGSESHLMITDPPYGVGYGTRTGAGAATSTGASSRGASYSMMIAPTGGKSMRKGPPVPSRWSG